MMKERAKVPRSELVALLVERDGLICQYPGDEHELDLSVVEGPREPTIDHWFPQWYGKENGWTSEQVWGLANLKLMCKAHNAKKGDRIPNEDGTLPVRVTRTFKFRRQKRAERAEICTTCDAGRKLGPSEVCASCSSGPMPERFPRWAKARSSECDHELFWCAWCSIGIIPRVPAVDAAVAQGESGEWD
jgi:hypothetical protein